MSQSRQLAAIMFTDIVGYTALMGNDEQKAFDLLNKNRQIQQPIIEQFSGRWIKELGDGVMASFNTVSDAVNAAIKIQEACNAAKDFQLRIGIHLGEVVFENDDVFGDGVNIASRIQAIATPGGIYISESVHHNVSNKKGIQTRFVKEETLKNVKEAVRIYEVFTASIVEVSSAQKKETKKLIDKSIAVLPFVNMSNDPDQEYFSDGITEDIITQVSKISDLKVISRTAVMQYKATKKTIQEIGKELDVATILEGSVRREGNQVRVVAQLINTQTNEHLWAETYDKELTQIFAIQSKVAEQIASALKAKFTPSDKEQHESKLIESHVAYDFYLRGKFHFNENNRPGIDTAIILFERAITVDPKFALVYASLARSYTQKFFSYSPQKKWREQAFVALEKALLLDPDLPEAYLARATLLWITENHFPHEQAVVEIRHALSLRPNFAEARRFLSSIYSHIGLHDKAFEELQKALELNPHDLETHLQLGDQFYYQQKYAEMLALIENLPKDFGGLFPVGRKAEVQFRMSQGDEMEMRVQELLQEFPNDAQLNSVAAIVFASLGKKEIAEEKIQIAILNGKKLGHFHHTTYNIGVAYALMNKHPEAISWLKKTAEDGMPCYTMFANDPYLNNLRSVAEFKSLLETLKKQWEHYKATL